MRSAIQGARIKLFVLVACLFSSLYSMAQDNAGTTSQTSSTATHSESTTAAPDMTMWYMNPVVWVIGGLLLIIIIVAITRSGKKTVSDSEVSRTTTVRTQVKED